MNPSEPSKTLTQQYQQIKAPPELETLVKDAVRRSVAHKRLERIKRYAKRTGGAAAAFLLSLTIMTNLSPEVAYALEQIPAIGAFTKAVTIRSFEHRGNNTEASIYTPQLEWDAAGSKQGVVPADLPGREALNQAMADYVNGIIDDYQQQLAEWGENIHLSVSTDYRVLTDDENLFSIQIISTAIMASSYNYSKIFHLDKQTGALLNLSDLFQPESGWQNALREEIRGQMAERIKEDEQRFYFTESFSIADNQNFYFDEKGRLVIVFDEYDVAPGAFGMQEFTIPDAVVKSMRNRVGGRP